MASPPSTKKVIADDLDDDWTSAKKQLLLPVNSFLSDVNDSLSGGLRLDSNLGCQVLSFRLQVPTDVVALTVNQNAWVNTGGALPTAYATKSADGRVALNGTIKSGTIGLTALTLPEGYRPDAWATFTTFSWTGAAYTAAAVKVLPDGTVTPVAGTNNEFWLSGISFLATNRAPYVPACFPLRIKCTMPGGRALKVELGEVVDVTPSSTPLAHGATQAVWHNDSGYISIDNIPGLIPGRTYSVTAVAYPR